MRLSFATLKEYIKFQYECISLATGWAEQVVAEEKSKWRRQKINRAQEPVEVFREISKILESRYENAYDIETAINYLECLNTIEENKNGVNQFRNAIIETIPAVCDAVEDLNNDLWAETLDNVIYVRPKKIHNGAYYQLEKIFSYLREDGKYSDNYEWGLKQAQYFTETFAKKWVTIKPYGMSCDEIKLLVSVACYMENLEQEGQIGSFTSLKCY